MLGSGKSSDSIWTAFDTHSTSGVRSPIHNVKVAWTRIKNQSTSYAVVGTSVVGGIDIVQGQYSIVTEPDKFEYFDETERVLSMYYDRRMEEPLGGLQYALGDVSFENTTNRYTWGVSDTIGTSLKPRRPIKMFMGFRVQSQDKLLPVLYGVTEDVLENRNSMVVQVPVMDYVSYINDYELESTTYLDKRTDEIIADILSTIGFTASQYSLDTGLNTIEYAWFDKGTKAGDAIKRLCESEEGHFYQDEEGQLKFKSRRAFQNNTTPTWTINPEDILSYERDTTLDVINRVIVTANPREVQAVTEIWQGGAIIEVPPSSTVTEWASFLDPAVTISTITAGVDYLGNSVSDGSGTDETADLSIVVTEFTTSAKLDITNNSASTIYVTFIRLRGEPAVVVNPIQEIYEDRASEETYGRRQLEINNDFIDSASFAYYLARATVTKYANPVRRFRVTILGMPSVQVRDAVSLKDIDTGIYNTFRVVRVEGRMEGAGFTTTLTLRLITDFESDQVAIVDQSVVNGGDVVGV